MHGHFKDITNDSKIDIVAHSSGAMFFDYDNDGLVDLLVCNVGVYTSSEKGSPGEYIGIPDRFFGHMTSRNFEHQVLYKNLGNYNFKDVTAARMRASKPTGGSQCNVTFMPTRCDSRLGLKNERESCIGDYALAVVLLSLIPSDQFFRYNRASGGIKPSVSASRPSVPRVSPGHRRPRPGLYECSPDCNNVPPH